MRSLVKKIALPVVLASVVCTGVVLAQRPEVKTNQGHILPVMAQATFPNGAQRTVMIVGCDACAAFGKGDTFAVHGENPEGVDEAIWIDTIAHIEDTTDESEVFVLKNGVRRRLKCPVNFKVANEDGGAMDLRVAKVKSIEFIRAPRRDLDGNAMFDNWRYSPFTGERLPAQ